jgi:hypothetical protein
MNLFLSKSGARGHQEVASSFRQYNMHYVDIDDTVRDVRLQFRRVEASEGLLSDLNGYGGIVLAERVRNRGGLLLAYNGIAKGQTLRPRKMVQSQHNTL